MTNTEAPHEPLVRGEGMGGKRSVSLQRCPRCGGWIERPGSSRAAPALCPGCLLEHSRIEAGEYFRASRLAAGLSVEQLAERSGIDSARIECFEDGQLAPGWKETALLFWVLGPLLPKPTPARRRAN